MNNDKSTSFQKQLFGEIYDSYYSDKDNPAFDYKQVNQEYNRLSQKIANYLKKEKNDSNLIKNDALNLENASIRFLLHYVMKIYADSASNSKSKWGKSNKMKKANALIDSNVLKKQDYRTFTNFIGKRLNNTTTKTIPEEQQLQECLYYISYSTDSDFMQKIPYKLSADSLNKIKRLISNATDSITPQMIFDIFTDILLTNLSPNNKEKSKENNNATSYIVFPPKSPSPNTPIDKIFSTKHLIDKFK